MAWFRKTTAAGESAEWAKPVTLNAGGFLYTTTRGSLRHLAEHPVFGPVVKGQAAPSSEDGAVFIDCDGSLFRHILNFLRAGGDGEEESHALCVPDSFDEWDQLVVEARRLQLPALEAAVASRYECQRALFLRILPIGVCVRWPTTVIIREGQQSAATAASPTTPTVQASSSGGAAAGVAGGVGLADQLARSALRVSITPALPSLWVAEDGRTVLYGPEAEVVPDLERLVLLLVSAYGYHIQHWQEREGRVFLSLPTGR